MPSFRKLGETELLRNPLIRVAEGRFQGPDGGHFERYIVRHPGAVAVVPVTSEATVLLVRQYRAAIDADLLEIPAGKRDIHEEPTETTARRELAEEVGRQAGRLELLARFYNSPGFTDEFTWCYLARHLVEVAHDRQRTEEQHMTVEELPLAEVPARIAAGQILDAKSVIGLCLALDRLRSEGAVP